MPRFVSKASKKHSCFWFCCHENSVRDRIFFLQPRKHRKRDCFPENWTERRASQRTTADRWLVKLGSQLNWWFCSSERTIKCPWLFLLWLLLSFKRTAPNGTAGVKKTTKNPRTHGRTVIYLFHVSELISAGLEEEFEKEKKKRASWNLMLTPGNTRPPARTGKQASRQEHIYKKRDKDNTLQFPSAPI